MPDLDDHLQMPLPAKPPAATNLWPEYERRKAAWYANHPQATAKDIERAAKAIARELGV